jgi:hypothetical protein
VSFLGTFGRVFPKALTAVLSFSGQVASSGALVIRAIYGKISSALGPLNRYRARGGPGSGTATGSGGIGRVAGGPGETTAPGASGVSDPREP